MFRISGWDLGEELHSRADDIFQRIAVFLHYWRAFSHHEKCGGTGSQVIGDAEGPEGRHDEEAVTYGDTSDEDGVETDEGMAVGIALVEAFEDLAELAGGLEAEGYAGVCWGKDCEEWLQQKAYGFVVVHSEIVDFVGR
jgi:hypothetical protein